MSAQSFNLQLASLNANLTKTEANASNSSANSTSAEALTQEIDKANMQESSRELSTKLSKSLLETIRKESNTIRGDRLDIGATDFEIQALNFSMSASVQAEDREIEVSLNVNLSRSFVQKTTLSIESLKNQSLVDPLIINLDGAMPSLSSKKFEFDLDSDGSSDQISKLESGNGFLALDKNSNGKIDNGVELFGTKSGDGFADLSKYDSDENGWIDENDAIFDKLRIWQKSEGKDRLVGLGEVGIGAIFLGSTQTNFSLKSETNELLGEIQKSGFALFENGAATLISHIDLAIESGTKEAIEKMKNSNKGLSSLSLDSLYNQQSRSSSSNENTLESTISKIRMKIKNIESKLASEDSSKSLSLRAQLSILNAQLMMITQLAATVEYPTING